MVFENIPDSKPDPILSLMREFRDDKRTDKVDLGVGVYRDESGVTPIMAAVKKAQLINVEAEKSKKYESIEGAAPYREQLQQLVMPELGSDSHVEVMQSLGGTGALFLIFQTLGRSHEVKPDVYIPNVSWANHKAIISAAGLGIKEYPYFDFDTQTVDHDSLLAFLDTIDKGSVFLFHGCCHNPTGADITPEAWELVINKIKEKEIYPIIDLAYHGFGQGLEKDAKVVKNLADAGIDFALAYSCSKNFGLYRDRVGAAMFVSKNKAIVERVREFGKSVARSTYSMPAHHGGGIVATILANTELRAEWEAELNDVRQRIYGLRDALCSELTTQSGKRSYEFIKLHQGMFSKLPLNATAIGELKARHGIYVVPGGRINIAGLTEDRIGYVAKAMSEFM